MAAVFAEADPNIRFVREKGLNNEGIIIIEIEGNLGRTVFGLGGGK